MTPSAERKPELRTPGGTRYHRMSGYKYRVDSVAKYDISARNALDLSGRDSVRIKNYHGTIDLVLITPRCVWIYPGYAWNGADIAWDTEDFLDGSLVHDSLCQAMNDGLIDPANYRRVTNIMSATNRKYKMGLVRVAYTHFIVNAHWAHKVKGMEWPRKS